MDRNTLLEQVEKKELKRLNFLTMESLKEEFEEWFGIEVEEDDNKESLINVLLEDYMQYRRDDLTEELEEVLTREIAFRCPLCQTLNVESKKIKETYIYVCDECPFIAFEYYLNNNLEDLTAYLNYN